MINYLIIIPELINQLICISDDSLQTDNWTSPIIGCKREITLTATRWFNVIINTPYLQFVHKGLCTDHSKLQLNLVSVISIRGRSKFGKMNFITLSVFQQETNNSKSKDRSGILIVTRFNGKGFVQEKPNLKKKIDLIPRTSVTGLTWMKTHRANY
jgi:hypothetical protein